MLSKVHELAALRQVRFTHKALCELAALDLELDEEDACHVLGSLASEDSAGRLISRGSGEWMYAFRPHVAGTVVYVKLVLRNDCIVVSFHAEERADDEEIAWRKEIPPATTVTSPAG